MAADSFDYQLDQALDFQSQANDPYGWSYNELKRIAASIEKKLNEGFGARPIKVEIEPGFQAEIGQQLRVNVRIPDKQFRDTLFRAYIPIDGLPISLDLYGEEPESCKSVQELQEKILDFVVGLKDRMASYREYARS